jgi:hypothetical protein
MLRREDFTVVLHCQVLEGKAVHWFRFVPPIMFVPELGSYLSSVHTNFDGRPPFLWTGYIVSSIDYDLFTKQVSLGVDPTTVGVEPADIANMQPDEVIGELTRMGWKKWQTTEAPVCHD